MRLINIGSNKTVLHFNRTILFFSYNTCVVACINNNAWYTSAAKHSKTTSTHISSYIGNNQVMTKPQEWFDSLLDNVSFKLPN